MAFCPKPRDIQQITQQIFHKLNPIYIFLLLKKLLKVICSLTDSFNSKIMTCTFIIEISPILIIRTTLQRILKQIIIDYI